MLLLIWMISDKSNKKVAHVSCYREVNNIKSQWHIHVSASVDKNKSTIHVTLATQVYTLDRHHKNREKKEEKNANNKLL